MIDDKSISIIIPAYNEEAVIDVFLRKLIPFAEENFFEYEIIVVNDGSSDNTLDKLEEFKNEVRVLSHPYNKGNGASVKTGIRNAVKEFVVMLDSDGQHDVKDIIRILDKLGTYDCVVGARTSESEGSFHRNMANMLYNNFATYASGFKIKDLTSGFRGFRRSVITKFLYLFPNGFSYPTTSTLSMIKAGYNLTYIPIKATKRVGKSKIKLFRDGYKFLILITKITVLFSPLKVFIPISAMFLLGGMSHMFYKVVLQNEKYTEFSIFLFSAGILFFLIGLISEQITYLRYTRIDEDI